ncbi:MULTISPECIES: HD-GYP domain-containing protein [Thiorhodovibrio]|uniref:HD-GYP domain-containing protein n=1 Tax=Thiorhodovibrio TaxID=61593 RepID=UPI001F5D8FD3|nr:MULTISPECIES: HD domain-containing phosphohydrolase [Thiorhodovibrio]WPL12713.1 Cyclic di-GMP phosphodiesterase response regulator RpfG [Thiorhodovibrio litoralis]
MTSPTTRAIRHPMSQVALRLALVGVVTSLLMGLAVWGFETERIDERVLGMAVAAANHIDSEALEHHNLDQSSPGELQTQAQNALYEQFVVVELYNRDREKLVEEVAPGWESLEELLAAQHHSFPVDDEVHYEKHFILNQLVLVVLVPVKNADGIISGYLEGVYVAAPEILARLKQDVLITVLVVIAAVLLTSLVMIPVILSLNRVVLERSRQVLRGNLETLDALGAAIAKRDSDTNIHNYRVTLLALELAAAAGMKEDSIRDLMIGAFLHDVGKIGISDAILLKPGKLTSEEFATMKTHVKLGVDIVSSSEWLQKGQEVVEFHHEKFDGSGYIRGLKGESIPLAARVFAIADVFDALTSKRPYKEPMSLEKAMAIIERDAGSHFDARLVDVFRNIAPALYAELSTMEDSAVIDRVRSRAEHYWLG